MHNNPIHSTLPLDRLSGDIGESHWKLFRAFGVTLPLLYLSMFLLRWLLIAAFVPLIHRLSKDGIHLNWKDVVFATMVGVVGRGIRTDPGNSVSADHTLAVKWMASIPT